MTTHRNRTRGAREIQRELGVRYSDALQIWDEQHPEQAARFYAAKRDELEAVRAHPPAVNVDSYLDSVEGTLLSELDLIAPDRVDDAYVQLAVRSGAEPSTRLMGLTNTELAQWRVTAGVRVTVAGIWNGTVEDAHASASVKFVEPASQTVTMRPRPATVSFDFGVRAGATDVRRMRVNWAWKG